MRMQAALVSHKVPSIAFAGHQYPLRRDPFWRPRQEVLDGDLGSAILHLLATVNAESLVEVYWPRVEPDDKIVCHSSQSRCRPRTSLPIGKRTMDRVLRAGTSSILVPWKPRKRLLLSGRSVSRSLGPMRSVLLMSRRIAILCQLR